eukprot:14156480-Alexandrium_andersonii.AAC.1
MPCTSPCCASTELGLISQWRGCSAFPRSEPACYRIAERATLPLLRSPPATTLLDVLQLVPCTARTLAQPAKQGVACALLCTRAPCKQLVQCAWA